MEYTGVDILIFGIIVLISLYLDLHLHKKDKEISVVNASLWSGFWILLAFGFAGYIYITHSSSDAQLFITGYLLEKSLSVDNLFVIMAIFSSFAIKDKFQHRILYYGILGAILLRLIFVGFGTSLVIMFGPYALGAFGLFVLWSAYKMWKSMGGDDVEIEDYSNHWSVKYAKKILPVSSVQPGHNFLTKINNQWHFTPFFLCLICVEIADVMFAFDSVPAIIAITQKPFLVYTSNIFAILGLRSLYFLLSAASRYLCHLEKSVILILIFIGVKMILDVINIIHITPFYSLLVVSTLLISGILGSIIFPEKPCNQMCEEK